MKSLCGCIRAISKFFPPRDADKASDNNKRVVVCFSDSKKANKTPKISEMSYDRL